MFDITRGVSKVTPIGFTANFRYNQLICEFGALFGRHPIDLEESEMDFTVREATMDDYDVVCSLMDEVDFLHRQALPHRYQAPMGMVREEEYIEYLINDRNCGFFVAQGQGELLGYVVAFVKDTPDVPILVPCRYVLVDNMGVNPNCRQQGVGRALMARVSEWAAAQGATRMELSVYDFNTDAQRFYDALGFKSLSHKLDKPL